VKQLVETEEAKEERLQKIVAGEEIDYAVSSEDAITEEHKKDVFVFDEDLLRENVRVEKDGLNTIVMLGEQVELNEQINAKKEELRLKTEQFIQQDELVRKYANAGENVSPLYYWNQIREGLRAEDGWAEIDWLVKGNRVMSRVTDDVVSTLTALDEPAETYEQVVREAWHAALPSPGRCGADHKASFDDVDKFFGKLEGIFADEAFTKAQVVDAIKEFIPNFEHEEKGKNLDQKM